jgi:MFS family permease
VPVKEVLRNKDLVRLNLGIFSLHAMLMAMFVAVPFELNAHVSQASHWKVYLGVMLASLLIMVPVMLLSERHHARKAAFVGAVGVIVVSELVLAFGAGRFAATIAGLVLFFAAFNLLEAALPSLVSRTAPANAKGTAIGVYSSLQFVGTFVGASIGGWIAQHYGDARVFVFCALIALIWLGVAATMRVPDRTSARHARP